MHQIHNINNLINVVYSSTVQHWEKKLFNRWAGSSTPWNVLLLCALQRRHISHKGTDNHVLLSLFSSVAPPPMQDTDGIFLENPMHSKASKHQTPYIGCHLTDYKMVVDSISIAHAKTNKFAKVWRLLIKFSIGKLIHLQSCTLLPKPRPKKASLLPA